MRSFYIKDNYNKYINQNIYKAIGSIYPTLSVGSLNKVFRLKDVKVNNVRVDKNYIIQPNDFIEIYLTDNILFGTPTKIDVIYEDHNIIVANKPIKLASCNETHVYNNEDIYFENLIRKQKNEALNICHRLDTNTEGLIIFSKNDIAHKNILQAFKDKHITKKYLTITNGKFSKNSDILKAHLVKNDKTSLVKIYDKPLKNSEEIITEYMVLEYLKDKDVSVVEVTLHTGKTHQIRAHLNYIGHSIIGEPKYSTNELNKKFKLKHQALVAYKYEFNFDIDSPLYYLNGKTIELNKRNTIQKLVESI